MSNKPLLLVAEDDPATAAVVIDLAKVLEWEVLHASNGTQAWALCQERQPEMLLLDYYMPDMDGFEVLSRARKAKLQMPIIIMTAATDEHLILEALRLGATDFLRKPFEHLLLLRTILRRENARYRTQRIQRLVATRVVHQAIEFEIENDLSLCSGVCSYIVGTLIPEESTYAIRLGLEELCANAVEHGNLGFSSEDKTAALRDNGLLWPKLLRERAAKAPYCDRRVRIMATRTGGMLEVTIQDQGDGFDEKRIPNPLAEENLLKPNGRGVFLARQQFDTLEYLGRGNIVRVTKRLAGEAEVE